MSDFLSALVERSVGATNTVRPQPLSIFEPPSASSGTFFHGHETPDVRATQRDDPESMERILRLQSLWQTTGAEPATQFVTGLSAADVTFPESAELPGGSPEVWPQGDPEGNQQSARPPGNSRGSADVAKAIEGSRDAIGPESSTVPLQVRPRIERLQKRQDAAPPSRERHPTPVDLRADEEGTNASRSQPSGRAPDAGNSEAVAPIKDHPEDRRAEEIKELMNPKREGRRALTQARDARLVSSPSPSSRPFAPSPQLENPPVAPSINVTIGRVEVRAILPPAPSKASRPSTPVLNLNEYLRRRAEGNRR